MNGRRSFGEWWADSYLALAVPAMVLSAVAFSLAPIWW